MRIAGSVARPTAARVAVVLAIAVLLLSPSGAAAQRRCSAEPLALQVLGSGGPSAGGRRASAGYLVWHGGRAVVMVDAGGGTFLRFGEAGARLQDLTFVLLSHLHPDHVSDLPALLWLSEVARREPLSIAGPSGAGAFPSTGDFVRRLFDPTSGAFPILGGTLGEAGQGIRLDVVTVDAASRAPANLGTRDGVEVTALGVPHGNVPSIAYRVRVGERSIVFGSDQTGSDAGFTRFAAGADVLVMHLGLSQRAGDPLVRLHARPTTVGEVARDARAGRLVLSHLMQAPPLAPTPDWFSLSNLDGAIAEVRKRYPGPTDAAADLQCFPIR